MDLFNIQTKYTLIPNMLLSSYLLPLPLLYLGLQSVEILSTACNKDTNTVKYNNRYTAS